MPSFSRQEFYDLVWTKSAVALGKEIGVSDVAIAKACKKHQIPKPPLGYWAKLQYGHNVTKPKLPTLSEPQLQTISIGPLPNHLRPATLSDETRQKVRLEKSDANKVVVAQVLDAPHPLVERTDRGLRSSVANKEGIVRPKAKGCLNVAVGVDSIDRAMRIMDALIKAIEARGMRVKVSEEHRYYTLILLDGESLCITLTESIGERPVKLTPKQVAENAKYKFFEVHKSSEKYPRGLLTLTGGRQDSFRRRRWSELDGKKLEDRLNLVIIWLYKEQQQIDERRRKAEEWERGRPERERLERLAEEHRLEEKRLRQDEEKRRLAEQQRIAQLERDADSWRKARCIRDYVDEIEKTVLRLTEGDVYRDVQNWLVWSRQHADSVDPVLKAARSIAAVEPHTSQGH